MGMARFEVEKFDGKGDFGLWRKKMRAILVQQKVAKALNPLEDLPSDMTEEAKAEMYETAYSTIILNLADNVLRQVNEEESAASLWSKLESLYLNKTLSNKIYLKERFFGFKMDPSKSLEENLDDFKKICIDLANTGEKIGDENEAIILLNSLPESYREVKAAIKYGRTSLTLEDCLSALRSRDLEIKIEKKNGNNGENLYARGRSDNKDSRSKSRGKSRSKSRGQKTIPHFKTHNSQNHHLNSNHCSICKPRIQDPIVRRSSVVRLLSVC